MKLRLASTVVIFALGQAISAFAQDAEAPLRLPLRVHIVTGIEMVREINSPEGEPTRTVMNMPVKELDVSAMMQQVNEIWAPAQIRWETDLSKGGGGIVTEQAGGGKLPKEKQDELARLVVARSREGEGGMNYMSKVFPSLGDPAQNDSLLTDRKPDKNKATLYHLYLFPYVGQTLQGTAHCPGTFAIVGAFSDKRPNKFGFPKLRPFCVPTKPGADLTVENFPADGALSATMAHELGHNLSLTHSDEGMPDNVMKGHVKLRFSPKQIQQARTQAMKGPLLR